jgi:hypothetical protein
MMAVRDVGDMQVFVAAPFLVERPRGREAVDAVLVINNDQVPGCG